MKTERLFLSLWLVVMLMGTSANVLAQGKAYGRDKHPGKGHDRKERSMYARHDSYNEHDHYVTYRHHRHGPPSWAPAYGYRYNTRYIYYKDYNVYYDCHRDIFITWTGRNWMISTRIPDVMCHVNFRTTAVMGVDYWGDDFDYYLGRKRPVYVSIQASW